MTWIIKRDGPYCYLMSKDLLACYSKHQQKALRFDKKWKAVRALKWSVCNGSWPTRIVKLAPRENKVALQTTRDLYRRCLARLFMALPEGLELHLDNDTAEQAALAAEWDEQSQ